MTQIAENKSRASEKESMENVLFQIKGEAKISGSDHANQFPIFKISPQGRIIYANRSAYPLLKEWNCYASNIIPQDVLSQFPSLTNLLADETVEISSHIHKFYLSVVGFPAGGYIGIYGYKTELRSIQNEQINN
ncbi:MAG: hypothetical protein EYC69_06750 [Bacteroidetes bacterium]|nr:MAG: hypothetical protein EYC69_06750 [Bacteroidota bacterium]